MSFTEDSRFEVKDSADYRRIKALPQREIDPEECERLAEELTPLLTTPRGKRHGVRLKPLQALAFKEMHEQRGAHLGLPVGEGKTLICMLAPHVLDAKRAVLIVPASLKDKTYAEFIEYSKDWTAPMLGARIISYHDLRADENLLRKIKPDLIILDEADAARAHDRSAAQMLGEYIGTCRICASILKKPKACKHLPMVITMTGTGTRFSITDFSHFLIWALKDNAPVPLDPKELAKWGWALDELKPGRFGMVKRWRPGVLVDLTSQKRIAKGQPKKWSRYANASASSSDVMLARGEFQKRLRRTPGVIIVDGTACDQPLTINHVLAPEDPEIDEMFETFRGEGETPDGDVLTDSFAEYRFAAEAGAGMFSIWEPPPPEEWMKRRKACFRFIRRVIEESRGTGSPLYTEGRAIKRYRHEPVVQKWLKIRKTFKPNSVPRWVSGSVVYAAREWAKKNVGLIFTRQVAVGRAIAEVSGLEYYGAKGKNDNGQSIEKADPTRSAVLSIDANLRGRNLQGWHRMLVIGCPQAATQLEQLIGREHRYGQLRGVIVDILITSGDAEYAFEMAEREARFVLETQGQKQKILRAKVNRVRRYPSESSRWLKKVLADQQC
jgi:hypothetical protein